MDVARLLRDLDVVVSNGRSPVSWQLRAPDGMTFDVELRDPVRHLDAHAVRAIGRSGNRPLLVAETATDGVLGRARRGEFDLLLAEPPMLAIAGTIYGEAAVPSPEPEARRPGKPAWIRWAVARFLLVDPEPVRQQVIADSLGTSQQAVSQACRALGDLVRTSALGVHAPDRGRLLEHWLRNYPGPGGSEFGWYSLDGVIEQTERAVAAARRLDADPLVSGDVAADRLAPWKLPTRGLVYVSGPIDLGGDAFVPAPLEEATLITRVPRDPTVWALPDYEPAGGSGAYVALADPALTLWDLRRGLNPDAEEAASHLTDFLIGSTR